MAQKKHLSTPQTMSLLGAIALALFALWSVASPIARAIDLNARLESRDATVSRLERAVRLKVDSSQGAEPVERRSPFLLSNSRSLAAAELQSLLNEKLNKLQLSPASTEIQFPDNVEGIPSNVNSVQLRLNVEVSEGELSALLPLLESGYPSLQLKEIFIERDRDLRSKPAPTDSWQKLDVSFAVVGYWTEENDG